MDIEALAKGVGLFSSALSALKQVIDLLPDNSRKTDAAATLERAEREFKVAEAETAGKLGYPLCRRHFPPGIMLLTEQEEHYKCRECGYEKKPLELDSAPTAGRSRWRL